MQWTDLLSNIKRYTQQHKISVSTNFNDLNAVFFWLQISRHKTRFLSRTRVVSLLFCGWNINIACKNVTIVTWNPHLRHARCSFFFSFSSLSNRFTYLYSTQLRRQKYSQAKFQFYKAQKWRKKWKLHTFSYCIDLHSFVAKTEGLTHLTVWRTELNSIVQIHSVIHFHNIK